MSLSFLAGKWPKKLLHYYLSRLDHMPQKSLSQKSHSTGKTNCTSSLKSDPNGGEIALVPP